MHVHNDIAVMCLSLLCCGLPDSPRAAVLQHHQHLFMPMLLHCRLLLDSTSTDMSSQVKLHGGRPPPSKFITFNTLGKST